MKQTQLKQYKAELETVFFSGQVKGEVANMMRREIIRVGKQITPTPISEVNPNVLEQY